MKQSMFKQEPFQYYQIKSDMTVSKTTENEANTKGNTIRKVEDTTVVVPLYHKYEDSQFDYSLQNLKLVDQSQELIWARLGDLVKPEGSLFVQNRVSRFDQTSGDNFASFFYELSLIPISFYKSLFEQSTFTSTNSYRVQVNWNGHFRTVVIDDKIPVYKKNKQPLWRMELEVYWELLLLKVWAKIVGGYKNVLTAKPLDFIRTFTYPNWRIKNLELLDTAQAYQYIQQKLVNPKFTPNEDQYEKDAPPANLVIARTKNNPAVLNYGLLPNTAAYQIYQAFVFHGEKVLKIKATTEVRWNGDYSVADTRMANFYNCKQHNINLSNTFIISFKDFKELFNILIFTPTDYRHIQGLKYTYLPVKLDPNTKKGQQFQIILPSKGKIDISIVQDALNVKDRQPQNHNSQITPNQNQQNQSSIRKKRFLKMKILIAKEKEQVFQGQVSQIQNELGPNGNAQIFRKGQDKYEFFQGEYTKGDISSNNYFFGGLDSGRYVVHVKLQTTNKPSQYTVNIVSETNIQFRPLNWEKEQKQYFLRSTFLNVSESDDKFILKEITDKKTTEYGQVVFGNTFKQFGYGYITFKSTPNSDSKVYCQFNPKDLKEQGYEYKDLNKNSDKVIGLFSSEKVQQVILLKKTRHNAVWPPNSIKFYRFKK